MNTDLLSTIMGGFSAVMTAVMTFNAPVGTPTWIKTVGYVGAVSMAVWGYLTNKRP